MREKKVEFPLRILIVDDHLVVRMGLAALISLESDMIVVGEADDGVSAIEAVRKTSPDIIIMDIMMPQINGAEATARIHAQFPNVRILILTTFSASEEVRQALEAGASGALIKDSNQRELVAAIRAVSNGSRILSPAIARNLDSQPDEVRLSPRQCEMLEYVSKGLSNSEIGKLFGIGHDCVKAHLKTIYARLGAATRAEAVSIALRKHILKI